MQILPDMRLPFLIDKTVRPMLKGFCPLGNDFFSFQSPLSAPCPRWTLDFQEKTLFFWWRWKRVVHLTPLSRGTNIPSANVHWLWNWTKSPSRPPLVSHCMKPHSMTRKSPKNTHTHAWTHTYAHTCTYTPTLLQLTFKWCSFHSKVTKFLSNLRVLRISSWLLKPAFFKRIEFRLVKP